MEPPNNGHVGDEHIVHCSEVVPSSEVEMYGQYIGRGEQCVHCREVVSECLGPRFFYHALYSECHFWRSIQGEKLFK